MLQIRIQQPILNCHGVFFTIQIFFNETAMTNKFQNLVKPIRIGQKFCENSGSYLVVESGEQYVSFFVK